jgi:ADP-heptose:LPS heptosyltransferase
MLLYGGKIQFQQELQLISNLDVMLSMDSGNAHIAAMLSSYALGLHILLRFFTIQPTEQTL